ncbi:hypothetical protein [Streptomyces sp. NPDC005374]|uniref:hypothetical protein n=1 Tax=Streptomyces sp. NPDC005374 TaxID=3364713 RepID=UPI003692E13B
MDAFFYLLPGLIMAGAVFAGYRVLRRWLQIRSAWNSGLTAEARCLRAYTTTHGGSGDTRVRTTLHHVYEFTTRDGQVVRFEEEDGPGTTVEGDIVTVHHTAGPGIVATAQAPGSARHAVAAFGTLVVLGVVVVFCVGFMVTFAEMSSGANAGGF